ncbi:MAG: hypothetical protein ACYS22_00095 [Planctomycetota bacterium]|jgi:hypothetical protein
MNITADNQSWAGASPRRPKDALEPPQGLLDCDVRRSFDLETLRETAPDVAPERLRRVVKIREAIRQGSYCTRPRLALALERALESL